MNPWLYWEALAIWIACEWFESAARAVRRVDADYAELVAR